MQYRGVQPVRRRGASSKRRGAQEPREKEDGPERGKVRTRTENVCRKEWGRVRAAGGDAGRPVVRECLPVPLSIDSARETVLPVGAHS